MSEQNLIDPNSVFNKPLQKHGLLEELNVPPKAIKFIRENKTALWVGLVVFAVAVLGNSYYQSYMAKKTDNAATLLTQAMDTQPGEERTAMLTKLAGEYDSTNVAVWGDIEKGQDAFVAGKIDDAIAQYQKVLAEIAEDGPLFPLLQLNLAQAYEKKGQLKEAQAAYKKLESYAGFAGEAYLAEARIYEEQGAKDQAKELYEKIVTLENEVAGVKDLARSKLANL